MMPKRSRREFLRTSIGVGAGFWISTRGLAQSTSANEKLNVAVVGIEGQGRWNLGQLAELKDVNLVALCDVDEKRVAGAREQFSKARFAVDYRKLLDSKDIDAVLIATPDHHHAPAALRALQAGKHVYCEKPLSHTVDEARLLTQTAARMKKATQMGTQIHAQANYRRVVEAIGAGAIGAVSEVHVWVGRQWGGMTLPPETSPIPEGLHWDLWLGPAPEQPFYAGVYVPGNWRSWWDFGGGTLGDMGCHYMDLPFWALDLKYPKSVSAEGPPVDAKACPPWMIVHYEFPARKEQPPVKFNWYHGGKRPELVPEPSEQRPGKREYRGIDHGDGVLFVGSKGMLMSNYDQHVLLPQADFKDYKPPAESIPPSPGHHREWVDACKGGPPAKCNFDYAGPLAESVLLGNVAYRVGKPIEWDPVKLKATNAPEADKYIQHQYRKEWKM